MAVFWHIFLHVGCSQAILVHIVPHATDLQISAGSATYILTINGSVGLVARLIMGGIGDRIGYKTTMVTGLIVVSGGLFWLLVARETWIFYRFAVINGFGAAGVSVLFSPLVAWLFGLKSHGVILGAITAVANIGAALGPIFAGYVFDVTESYRSVFLTFAILILVATVLALLLRPTSSTE